VVRLRTVSPKSRGWSRQRRGDGFVYLDSLGQHLTPEDTERCEALVIPPAWEDVWICSVPNGHLQAVGTDDAGRRQYLYHEEWRKKRDKSKHDRVLTVAARLPQARRKVKSHLAMEGMPYERALATAFRLLDLGFFRIGGETYAEANNTFGLATIQKQHVTIEKSNVVFDFIAKSGKERYVALGDDLVRDAVQDLLRRRGGSEELLAYREGGEWHDVTSADINVYIKEIVGGEVSAKDFRTWHGTVIAEVALARVVDTATSATARKRAVSGAMKEVSSYLGNTPTVARSSYVDPRVIDLFNDGATIDPKLAKTDHNLDDGFTHGRIEKAVLTLLKAPKSQLREEYIKPAKERQAHLET
jgi:DNA topoisomerase-1